MRVLKQSAGMIQWRVCAAAIAVCSASFAQALSVTPQQPDPPTCKAVYLTLDTGNMSAAQLIADTLNRHQIKATFFLANEKTKQGDYSLDPSWTGYWKARAAEGHAFGSHTFDHVYFAGNAAANKFSVKPQFGANAARVQQWDGKQLCSEIARSNQAFKQMTGQSLSNFWRAPGGKGSQAYFEAAHACGFTHVGWAPAGFLGDELSSASHPNDMLLKRSLANIREGDVLMAHLGIWSRKDPFAPMLDPLIGGLKQKGFCFKTLHEHPQIKAKAVNTGWNRD